jgi:two-component system OmpR family response regulator
MRVLVGEDEPLLLEHLTAHLYARTADRDSNTVEVFVARLRRELGGTVLETVRGLRYRIGEQP